MKKITILTILLMMLTILPLNTVTVSADSLKNVRVGLFIHEPSQYSNLTKSATIHSSKGMRLEVKGEASSKSWLSFAENTQVRLSLTDYKVKLMETSSFESALQSYKAVQAAGGTGYIISMQKNNKLVYQVLEGGYVSLADAEAAYKKWKNTSSLSGFVSGTQLISGPLALEDGKYTTQNEAITAAAVYGAQGVDTAVGVKQDADGKTYYSVVIGMVATQAELDLVKVAAGKVKASIPSINGTENMLILRHDHSKKELAGSFEQLYMFNPHMTVTIKPDSDGVLTLKERSERSYRGSLELGRHNNHLYVVNELPLEQYLYAVVAVEMYTSWPIEALKAQAVASRTFVAQKGLQFTIAHVVDTTLSQAYYGVNAEHANSIAAVDATKGEIINYNGKPIDAVYSSSAGGVTANSGEVWTNDLPYLQSVKSEDSISEENLYHWYRVVLPNGMVGYIREDLVNDTKMTNPAGKPVLISNTDNTNIRKHPIIEANVPAIAQINKGVELIALEKVIQSNPMSWRRGPYNSDELLASINRALSTSYTSPITSLEISSRGESGRATGIQMNGQSLKLANADRIRSLLGVNGSLPSTLFDIEATGHIVILGAANQNYTKQDGAKTLQVLGASGQTETIQSDYMFILNGAGELRAATKESGYQFTGTGNGHGVGMSQYGAYALARQGYDYQYILKYYYNGITIAKDE